MVRKTVDFLLFASIGLFLGAIGHAVLTGAFATGWQKGMDRIAQGGE